MSENQTFMQKLIARLKEEASEKKEEIDRELPFVVMLFALLSTSGVSLFDSWKRLRKMNLLPRFQQEAKELVRQVEVLGKDPLNAIISFPFKLELRDLSSVWHLIFSGTW